MPHALPRSRRSTLLADPGLTDCTCASRPGLPPGQARAPPGLRNSSETARTTLPGRARSATDLTPDLSFSVTRMSPKPGISSRPPSRARRRQKGHLAASAYFANRSVAGRNPDHGTGSGRAITGRLKMIPMFAQVGLYRKHCARARDKFRAARARRSTVLATRRRDPPRPMRTRSRQARTYSRSQQAERLCPPACPWLAEQIGLGRLENFVASAPSRARRRQKGTPRYQRSLSAHACCGSKC